MRNHRKEPRKHMERVERCSAVQCTVVEFAAMQSSEFGQKRGQIGGQRAHRTGYIEGKGTFRNILSGYPKMRFEKYVKSV